MTILKTPEEYAALLKGCYHPDLWIRAVFEAAQAHPRVPASFFVEVLTHMKEK